MLRLLGFLFTAGVILFLGGAAVIGYVLWKTDQELPDYEVLRKYEPKVMTRVHAGNGTLIAEYANERRLYVPIDAIPDQVIHAFMSAEDKNFYKHSGIDFQGIARAVVVNLRNVMNGRRLVGASTITQQVAKNFLLTSDRTLQRKLKEMLLSLKIERAFTKDQILELYLNEIYLGLGSYGVAAASLNYFAKSLRELSLEEAAYLAALPKAPNNYHPFRFAKRAIERRNWVMERMLENGYITPEQSLKAQATKLNVTPRPFGAQLFAAEYFAEEVRREIIKRYGEKRVYEGGMSVRTTLDPQMQEMARLALINGLVAYDRKKGWRGPVKRIATDGDWGKALGDIKVPDDIKPWRMAVVLETGEKSAKVGLRPGRLASGELASSRTTGTLPLKEMTWARAKKDEKTLGPKIKTVGNVVQPGDVIYVAPSTEEKGVWRLMQIPEIEGAIVALDPHTGRVHAMVGGFSYAQSEFNRATQANRQPGSSFKPFVYATALDKGYTPASVVLDAPIEVRQPGSNKVWKPKNYGGKFYGPSTLRLGIEKSRNVMTVRLAQDMGMDTIASYARNFGIYDKMLPVLSMALGAGETTLLRMTAAFGMLANGGKRIEATLIDRIQDRRGKTIFRHDGRVCAECVASEWRGQPEPVLPDGRAQIIDPHTAYQITSMLEGVVQRGTATKVKAVGKPIAGKTGTTNEERDAWFVGYSPDLVVGVFIGFDTPKPMGRGSTGGGLAAPVFTEFMQHALAKTPAIPFRMPPGINLIPINAKTGQMAQLGDEDVILESFKPGEGPPRDMFIIGAETAWYGEEEFGEVDRYRDGYSSSGPLRRNLPRDEGDVWFDDERDREVGWTERLRRGLGTDYQRRRAPPAGNRGSGQDYGRRQPRAIDRGYGQGYGRNQPRGGDQRELSTGTGGLY